MEKTVVVKDTVSALLRVMELTFTKIHVAEDQYGIIRAEVEVEEEDAPLMIGTFGQSLSALQSVVKSLLWKQDFGEKSSVRVDINGYRKRQEDRMITAASEKCEAVQSTGMSQVLPPMNPFLRRIIHLYIANTYEGLETESIGEEGHRKIQIKKKRSKAPDLG